MEKAAWQASGHSRERKADSAVCAPKLPTPGPSAAPSSVPPPQSRLILSPRPLGPFTQAGSEPEPSCTTGPGNGQVSIGRRSAPQTGPQHPPLSTQRSPVEDLLQVSEGVEPARGAHGWLHWVWLRGKASVSGEWINPAWPEGCTEAWGSGRERGPRRGWLLRTYQGALGFRQELSKLGEQVLLAAEEVGHLSEHLLFRHASEGTALCAQLLLL